MTNALAPSIQVGVTATNGDFDGCGAACDLSIPADFDFVQITLLNSGEIPPDVGPGAGAGVVQGLTIEGSDAAAPGTTTGYSAMTNLGGGMTGDVTGLAVWTAVPPERGSMAGGQLTTNADADGLQITIVAEFTDTVDGSEIIWRATKLVLITSDRRLLGGMCGTGLCGVQVFGVLPAGLIGIRWMRRRVRRRSRRSRP